MGRNANAGSLVSRERYREIQGDSGTRDMFFHLISWGLKDISPGNCVGEKPGLFGFIRGYEVA